MFSVSRWDELCVSLSCNNRAEGFSFLIRHLQCWNVEHTIGWIQTVSHLNFDS